jgi:hypothetical protein
VAREVMAGEAVASRRRVYFFLVGTDGMTPATGEAGGQPQASVDGGAWSGALIGTLSHVGHGRYHADLASAAVASAGSVVETRYKSAATLECPGDTAVVVGHDPHALPAAVWNHGARTLTSAPGSVVVVAPVVPADGGPVPLVRGDDYAQADGRALSWAVRTQAVLTGASVSLVVYDGLSESAGVLLAAAGSVSGSSYVCELTAAQTALLPAPPAQRRFELKVTLASGRTLTEYRGLVEVIE